MKALVLFSGGMDSVVVAKFLQEGQHQIGLVFINYGQLAKEREEAAAVACANELDVPLHLIDAPGVFSVRDSQIVGNSANLANKDLAGAAAWVPARNLVLTSLAVVQAVRESYQAIAIGNIADGIYSDNKPDFCVTFNHLLPHATNTLLGDLRLVAPINHLTKLGVVRLAIRIKAPIFHSWSCYTNEAIHCGVCGSCQSRRNAFTAAGETDPVRYADPRP